MHTLEATITTFIPGRTGCLQCYVPEVPSTWKRQFPVFGAVSGTVACLGAMEVIKLITGIGTPLTLTPIQLNSQIRLAMPVRAALTDDDRVRATLTVAGRGTDGSAATARRVITLTR